MKLMNKEKTEIKEADVEEVEEKDSTKDVEKDSKDYLLEEYYRKKEQERNKSNSSFKLFFIIVVSFVVGGVVMLSLLKFTPLLNEVLGGSTSTTVTKNKTQVYEKGSVLVQDLYIRLIVNMDTY